MDKYFFRIEEIIAKKRISPRIKFLMWDVQELREVRKKTQLKLLPLLLPVTCHPFLPFYLCLSMSFFS